MKRGVIVLSGLLALTGCTSGGSDAPSTSRSTVTDVVTHTRTPSDTTTFDPPAARTAKPLAPGAKPHAGEVDRACPYIRTGLNETAGGGVNLADIEGDRVYRTTVLTRRKPLGCRFYFYAPPYEAIADILPRRFASEAAAYNAMIKTARTGTGLITEKDFVPGATGICYRTKFFGVDGKRDWAFVFAKGKVLVVVHTQRTDTSRNALYLAQAIAGKF